MPTLTPDTHQLLLAAYFNAGEDFFTAAARHGLTILQALTWAESTDAKADIDRIGAFHRQRALALAEAALPAAVEALARSSDNLARIRPKPESPIPLKLRLAESTRKATTAIARLARPSLRSATHPQAIASTPESSSMNLRLATAAPNIPATTPPPAHVRPISVA